MSALSHWDAQLMAQYVALNAWQVFVLTLLGFAGLYFVAATSMNAVICLAKRWHVGQVLDTAPLRRHQIRDEIRASCLSIVVFAAQGVFLWWLIQQGVIQPRPLNGGWDFVLQLLALFLINEIHFYASHRFLHLKWWFRHVHGQHHTSRIATPYSTFSFHPFEAFLLGSVAWLAFALYPFSLLAIGLLPLMSITINVQGHSNYHFFGAVSAKSVLHFVPHHQTHHRQVKGNFGFFLPYLDRWLGSEIK